MSERLSPTDYRRINQRSVKCPGCGVRDFYFYRPIGEAAPDAGGCEAGRGTADVLADSFRAVHHCNGAYHAPTGTQQGLTASSVTTAETAKPVASDAAVDAKALADALSVIARATGGTAQVDPEQVAAIARIEADAAVTRANLPTRIEVHDTASDEVRAVGVTHRMFPMVLSAVRAGCNVMLVGPAGTGKSHLAQQVAEALGVPFGFNSVTMSTPTSEMVGYMDANGRYVSTPLYDAYCGGEDGKGGLYLLDEVDNGHPNANNKLNALLANGHMAFPNGIVERGAKFGAMSAANTYGTGADRKFSGRNQLDWAFLDRWITVHIGYDRALEAALCGVECTGSTEPAWAPVDRTGEQLQSAKQRLAEFVWALREAVDRTGLNLAFGFRGIDNGARLLSAGWPMSDVIACAVRKGTSDQDWRRVTEGIPVPA